MENFSEKALLVLGDIVYERLRRGDSRKTLNGKLSQGLNFFENKAMAAGLESAHEIAKRGGSIVGVDGFLAKYATRQRYQNDPIGTVHVCRELAQRNDSDNIVAFERRVDKEFEGVVPPIMRDTESEILVGRRADVTLKVPPKDTLISQEYKGSARDAGSKFRLKKTEELEFLNDVVYYSHPASTRDFEWIIAKQLDFSSAQNRMKEMLGLLDGNLDPRLELYISKLDSREADAFLVRLDQLSNKLTDGTLIKSATYDIL